MKIPEGSFKNKSFAIYGLGKTGQSAKKYLKKNRIKNFFLWDDSSLERKKNKVTNKILYSNQLDKVDYIIISPGIDIKKTIFKKKLIRNKKKIITDLDLFYLKNKDLKSIVVTGTNGKSTTCQLIHHILSKKGIPCSLGGNIGNPILNLKFSIKNTYIIEASSFQLEYSKFIKPNFALFLNLSNDHLDWHKNFKNYKKAKFKIFKNQNKKDYSFIANKKLINFYRKKKYKAKLDLLNNKIDLKKIKNIYLKSKSNIENLHFVFNLSKKFKIKKNEFFNYANSFKGLAHRYEIFLKYKNTLFINDSKATSFEASKYALMSEKNIYWIVGGLPKINDKFYLKNISKNITKAYIIGKNIKYFKNQLENKVKFVVSNNMNTALLKVLKDIKYYNNKKKIVLLSPSSASFDQYKNFEERGNHFKKLIKNYAKKIL